MPRKQTNAAPMPVRELIAACVTRAQWHALIDKQVELALDGNRQSLELLLEYMFGRARTEEPPPPDQPEPIRMIRVMTGPQGPVEREEREFWPSRGEHAGAGEPRPPPPSLMERAERFHLPSEESESVLPAEGEEEVEG